MTIKTKDIKLEDYLSCVRPHDTAIEHDFIERFILDRLPSNSYSMDSMENIWVTISNDPRIAWSCHTDTVGTGYRKTKGYRKPKQSEFLFESPDKGCLGADDGTGIWMMMRMINERKPGLYIFHRAEEIGGFGSEYASIHETDRLLDTQSMIALDRMDYSDVITHQAGGRCCSDEFAQSVADAIGVIKDYSISQENCFKPCPTGVFTDTANYIDVVGECTNLSVGYFSQHTSMEIQDIEFANRLLEKLMNVDADDLVFKRKPGEFDMEEYEYYYDDGFGMGGYGYLDDPFWDGNFYTHEEYALMEEALELYPSGPTFNDRWYGK